MSANFAAHPHIQAVQRHLMDHLGPPDEVFEVSGSPLPTSPVQTLNLAYFAPAGPDSPVVYVTCGASLFAMKDGRRVEALTILRREPTPEQADAVHRLLGSFALFAELNDEVVRVGDVVRAENELAKLSRMDTVLFMPPVPFVPSFYRVSVPSGPTAGAEVEMIWLLPVYASEAAYALKHGAQALMMLFAAQDLDLTDPSRAEANTLLDPREAQVRAQRAAEEAAAQRSAQAQGPKKPGSFEAAEVGNTVRISRRGGAPPSAPPPPEAGGQRAAGPASSGASAQRSPDPRLVSAPPEPQPTRGPAPRAGSQSGTAAPRGPDRRAEGAPARGPRPLVPAARVEPEKTEVRFDLSRGQTPPAPPPRSPPPRAARPQAARPDGPEARALAKKQEIETLKAQAKEIEARAAARRAMAEEEATAVASPPPAAAPPRPQLVREAPQSDPSGAGSAVRRRGAPTTITRAHVDPKTPKR
jgi:hypothetical protein